MNLSGLSFDNIPPLHVPLRFFQTAPLFGIAAALVLLVYPAAFASRWQPELLAITHLLTLGFGASIMLGALFQVMPVVTGQTLPRDAALAPWIRWALSAGVLLLTSAFLSGHGYLFGLATLLLLGSFILFVGALGWALLRVRPLGDSAFCLRLAALSLVATLALGVAQASARYWPGGGLYHPAQTDLHAAWGGVGWSLGLIMAVAIQVIPMFHVTPAFPSWVARRLAPALFILLSAYSLYRWPWLQSSALAGVFVGAILFASCALATLAKRKRKLVDWTVRFWWLGLAHLLATAVLALLHLSTSGALTGEAGTLLIGLGYGLGFVGSVMIGMLQKIVPFLVYLHLQRACLSNPTAMLQLPNMKEIISSRASRIQFYLHAAALGLLYLAVLMPPLAAVAALVLLLDFAWLTATLWRAAGTHTRALAAMTEAPV